ncbi:hypothetical protein CR513_32808, partial [Mucuna pruriens]
MTRSSSNNLHAFDPKIDRTLHRLRNVRNADVGDNDSFISVFDSVNNTFTTDNFDFSEFSSFDINSDSNIVVNTSHKLDPMENNDRTLKELATSDCCTSLGAFDIRSEDPHKHLKKFHMVCSTKRLHGIPDDYIKMKAFPFSLDRATKD